MSGHKKVILSKSDTVIDSITWTPHLAGPVSHSAVQAGKMILYNFRQRTTWPTFSPVTTVLAHQLLELCKSAAPPAWLNPQERAVFLSARCK